MGINVVLEDPNLRLFTKYPYTSLGMYVFRPGQCGEVSISRTSQAYGPVSTPPAPGPLTFFKAGEQELGASLRPGGTISAELDAEAAGELREKLLKSKGIFEVSIERVSGLASGLDGGDRKQIQRLAGKNATINAPNGEAGPLSDLLGLFHESCLSEERRTAPLDVSSWVFNAGMNVPGFMVTPSLRYRARALQLDCMIVGNKKSGFVKLHPPPYTYMGSDVTSIRVQFESGGGYELKAKLSDDGDTVESHLALEPFTQLARAMAEERDGTELRIAGSDEPSRLEVPHAIPQTLLEQFLGRCH